MAKSAEPGSREQRRELILLLAVWLALATAICLLAKQNLSIPGLYYDEAVFAGLAKDFVTGHVHGQHMPDHEVITFAGRQFPLFVQTYLGALKSWMLIPAFKIFGSTFAVLRASNIFWQLVALLLLMFGARRWLGLGTALIAGALLVFDPTYFFVSTLDWGVAVPSLVCRCGCFLSAIRWIQMRKLRDAFLVGLLAGLGFFNKVDFVVFLIAVGVATLICYWRKIFVAVQQHSGSVALACLGFAFGAGPMLLKIPRMITLTTSGPHPPGQLVKFKTLMSMYDSSHFYRLMNVGGVFERMYDGASGPMAALGIALIAALIAFAFVFDKDLAKTRRIIFLVISAGLITLGVFLLPDAVRIHHAVLVYPLPHLIIAAVAELLWNSRALQRAAAVIGVAIVCLSGLRSILATETLIQQTGGRGRWSESLNQFCRENASRSDLTIVSLDWGFNEQLMFLTDGPQLAEPFWDFRQSLPPLPADPNYIFLVHPPEYSLSKAGLAYLDQFQKSVVSVEIISHLDRQNEVAFYSIRLRSP